MSLAQDVYRRAALAAAIAVKDAIARKTGVAAAAAEAATSLGVNPREAASIAVELEKQVERVGPDRLTTDESLSAAIAAAIGGVPSAANDGPQPTPPLQPAPASPIDTAALYRELARLSDWEPLARLADALRVADPEQLKAQLERLCSEEFVIVKNEHVYVTDRGHRFLEYASLT